MSDGASIWATTSPARHPATHVSNSNAGLKVSRMTGSGREEAGFSGGHRWAHLGVSREILVHEVPIDNLPKRCDIFWSPVLVC